MSEKYGSRTKVLQSLQGCSLFKGVTDADLTRIADQMELMTTPAGSLIIQHGDHTNEIYFLLSGTVIGQLVAQNGREIVFMEIAAGGYFGELAALDGTPRSITISANADCRFARMTGPHFMEMLLGHPQVAINLARALSKQLRKMNERIFGLVVHDVDVRVRIRLSQLAQEQEQLVVGGKIANAPTHEALANFIGSNREAVSRAISRLSKAGIILASRGQVVIRDLERLLAPIDGSPN